MRPMNAHLKVKLIWILIFLGSTQTTKAQNLLSRPDYLSEKLLDQAKDDLKDGRYGKVINKLDSALQKKSRKLGPNTTYDRVLRAYRLLIEASFNQERKDPDYDKTRDFLYRLYKISPDYQWDSSIKDVNLKKFLQNNTSFPKYSLGLYGGVTLPYFSGISLNDQILSGREKNTEISSGIMIGLSSKYYLPTKSLRKSYLDAHLWLLSFRPAFVQNDYNYSELVSGTEDQLYEYRERQRLFHAPLSLEWHPKWGRITRSYLEDVITKLVFSAGVAANFLTRAKSSYFDFINGDNQINDPDITPIRRNVYWDIMLGIGFDIKISRSITNIMLNHNFGLLRHRNSADAGADTERFGPVEGIDFRTNMFYITVSFSRIKYVRRNLAKRQ